MKKLNENQIASMSIFSYLFEDAQEVKETEKLSNLDQNTDDSIQSAIYGAILEHQLARRGITINEKQRIDFDCNVFAKYCLGRLKVFIMKNIWYIYNQDTGIYDVVEDVIIQKILKYVFDEHDTSYWKPSWERQYFQAFKLSVTFLNDIPNYLEQLCFTNGIVNLVDGSISEHSPDVIHTLQIPYDYDSTADCPNFKALVMI